MWEYGITGAYALNFRTTAPRGSSSNGMVLCDLCRQVNIRTYHIGTPGDIRREWFRPDDKVGVCGATSTPKWLLEEVAEKILHFA
jgi:4-hydroxy-3-methylbut-2-enyl diphosphate reductase